MNDNKAINVPKEIRVKIEKTQAEVHSIMGEANRALETKLDGKISLCYKHSAPSDILTSLERAQSVCFISRYEYLPILEAIDIVEVNGRFFLKDIGFIRHTLNEYRSIIMNQSDSIHFSKIHKFCYDKITNKNPSIGLSITVNHENGTDVTKDFEKILGEKNKAIKIVLKRSEFDYIYSGILQHSDHKYTKRFWDEYYTGKLNYVFIKHALLAGYIKDCLYWHYRILNQLTFPKLGPL